MGRRLHLLFVSSNHHIAKAYISSQKGNLAQPSWAWAQQTKPLAASKNCTPPSGNNNITGSRQKRQKRNQKALVENPKQPSFAAVHSVPHKAGRQQRRGKNQRTRKRRQRLEQLLWRPGPCFVAVDTEHLRFFQTRTKRDKRTERQHQHVVGGAIAQAFRFHGSRLDGAFKQASGRLCLEIGVVVSVADFQGKTGEVVELLAEGAGVGFEKDHGWDSVRFGCFGCGGGERGSWKWLQNASQWVIVVVGRWVKGSRSGKTSKGGF